MKSKNLVLIIVAAVLLVFGGCACSKYNGLVSSDNKVDEAWSNVETNYQRRTDLYSSIVKTVEASANFEKSTLKEVVEARAKATSVQVNVDDSASLEAFRLAQNQLQTSMSRLIASFEAYPTLKTTEAFLKFQDQIEGTENRINTARRDYNAAVSSYNLSVRSFPNNLFAGMFGFARRGFYKSDPGADKVPDLNYNIK